MFTKPPERIVYAYTEYQPVFHDLLKAVPHVILHQGLPNKEEVEQYFEGVNHTLLVLDDMMLKIGQSEDCVHLFTVTSHHRNISVIFLTQNLYPTGKFSRTISLNCLNVILFRNYRDARQVMTFGSQVLPGKPEFFKAAYEMATLKNYGYLHVCLEPNQNREYQMGTHIFPGEDMVIFQAK